MKDETAAADLKRQLERLEDEGWQTFWTKRDTGHKVIRREAPVKLDSSLEAYEDGIDPESPLLIQDRSQHMQILKMDPSKIDVVALEQTKDAQEAADKKRMFLASVLNNLNDNQAIDDPWSQGITDSGLIAFRLMWHMLEEMDEEETSKRVEKMRAEGEDDSTYESKKSERELTARDEYFMEQGSACWSIQPLTIGEYCYAPLTDNPDIFIQKSVIPYIENSIESKFGEDKGKFLTLDEAKKIVWLGEQRAPTGRAMTQEDNGNTTLTYFVRDAKDPKTGKRMITEFVCVGEAYGEAEKVNEYENPLGRCSFFPVASGGEVPLEKHPHHRYPAKMLPEIALISQLNYLQKHVMALARRNSMRPPFIDASKVTDAAAQLIREMPGWSEGVLGAQRGFVFELPDPGSNDLGVIPATVTKWPDEVDDHLAMLIAWTKEELAAVRPNRLLVGDYVSAAEPDTASAKLSSQQAAALPYGADLAKKGSFLRQLLDAIGHCIVEWDEDASADVQKKYYVRGTGSEPMMTGPAEAGKTVYVTAEDFKRPHFIKVETKNQTLQEQLMNNQESRTKYDRGEILYLDHLRNLGNDDPRSYAKQLELDRIERERRPRADMIRNLAVETYVSAKTGLNVVMLSGGLPQPMQGGQQAPQQPQQKFGVQAGTAPVVPGAQGDSVGAM